MSVAGAARPTSTRRRRPSFVERTIAGITGSVERALFSEEHARRNGLLQRRDARAKVIAFLVLVIAVNLSRQWPALVAFEFVAIAGAAASAIGIGTFLKRAWLGVTVFSGAVVLPSIFFIGGTPFFALPIGPLVLSVSHEGLLAAGTFVLRVGVSVSFAMLLVMTTPWAELLKSLRALRVPALFVVILAMTYRYIFLFLQTVNGIFLARQSRTVGRTSGPEQRRWVVQALGVLMHRSFRMSDEVYQAMLARGFDQRFVTLHRSRFGVADAALLASAVLLSVTITVAGGRLI